MVIECGKRLIDNHRIYDWAIGCDAHNHPGRRINSSLVVAIQYIMQAAAETRIFTLTAKNFNGIVGTFAARRNYHLINPPGTSSSFNNPG
jgi:hypothetical protein